MERTARQAGYSFWVACMYEHACEHGWLRGRAGRVRGPACRQPGRWEVQELLCSDHHLAESRMAEAPRWHGWFGSNWWGCPMPWLGRRNPTVPPTGGTDMLQPAVSPRATNCMPTKSEGGWNGGSASHRRVGALTTTKTRGTKRTWRVHGPTGPWQPGREWWTGRAY